MQVFNLLRRSLTTLSYKKYPHALYYIRNNKSFQLTFDPKSKYSIGNLVNLESNSSNDTLSTNSTAQLPDPEPTNFEPNPEFENLLYKVLSTEIYNDESVVALASHQKSGYLNVNDLRVSTVRCFI